MSKKLTFDISNDFDEDLSCKEMDEEQCINAEEMCTTIKNTATGNFASCRSKSTTKKKKSGEDSDINYKILKLQKELENLKKLQKIDNESIENFKVSINYGKERLEELEKEKHKIEYDRKRLAEDFIEKQRELAIERNEMQKEIRNGIKEKTKMEYEIEKKERENQKLMMEYSKLENDKQEIAVRLDDIEEISNALTKKDNELKVWFQESVKNLVDSEYVEIENTKNRLQKEKEHNNKIKQQLYEKKQEVDTKLIVSKRDLDRAESERIDMEQEQQQFLENYDKLEDKYAKSMLELDESKKVASKYIKENEQFLKKFTDMEKTIFTHKSNIFNIQSEIENEEKLDKDFKHKNLLDKKTVDIQNKLALKLFKQTEAKKLEELRRLKAKEYKKQKEEYKKILGESFESDHLTKIDNTLPVFISDVTPSEELADGWLKLVDYAGKPYWVNMENEKIVDTKPVKPKETELYNITEDNEIIKIYQDHTKKLIPEGWIRKFDKNDVPYYQYTGWEWFYPPYTGVNDERIGNPPGFKSVIDPATGIKKTVYTGWHWVPVINPDTGYYNNYDKLGKPIIPTWKYPLNIFNNISQNPGSYLPKSILPGHIFPTYIIREYRENPGSVDPTLINVQYEIPKGIPMAKIGSMLPSESDKYSVPIKKVKGWWPLIPSIEYEEPMVDLQNKVNKLNINAPGWKLKVDKKYRKYYENEIIARLPDDEKNKYKYKLWELPVRSPIRKSSIARFKKNKPDLFYGSIPTVKALNKAELKTIQDTLPAGWTAHRTMRNTVYFVAKHKVNGVEKIFSRWDMPTMPFLKYPLDELNELESSVKSLREEYFKDSIRIPLNNAFKRHRKQINHYGFGKNWSIAIDPRDNIYFYWKGNQLEEQKFLNKWLAEKGTKFQGFEGLHYRFKAGIVPLEDIGSHIESKGEKYYHVPKSVDVIPSMYGPENIMTATMSAHGMNRTFKKKRDPLNSKKFVYKHKVKNGKKYYKFDKSPLILNKNATKKVGANVYYNFENKLETKKKIRQRNRPMRDEPINISNVAPIVKNDDKPEFAKNSYSIDTMSNWRYLLNNYPVKKTRKVLRKVGRFLTTGRFNKQNKNDMRKTFINKVVKKSHALPVGWMIRVDGKNRVYYQGIKNGVKYTQWKFPINDILVYNSKYSKVSTQMPKISSKFYEHEPQNNNFTLKQRIDFRKARKFLAKNWIVRKNKVTNQIFYYNILTNEAREIDNPGDALLLTASKNDARKKELLEEFKIDEEKTKTKKKKIIIAKPSVPIPGDWAIREIQDKEGAVTGEYYYNETKQITLDKSPNEFPEAQIKRMKPQPEGWMEKYDIEGKKYIYINVINGHISSEPLHMLSESKIEAYVKNWKKITSPIDGETYWFYTVIGKGVTISIDPAEYILYDKFHKPRKHIPEGWIEVDSEKELHFENVITGESAQDIKHVLHIEDEKERRKRNNRHRSPPPHYHSQYQHQPQPQLQPQNRFSPSAPPCAIFSWKFNILMQNIVLIIVLIFCIIIMFYTSYLNCLAKHLIWQKYPCLKTVKN